MSGPTVVTSVSQTSRTVAERRSTPLARAATMLSSVTQPSRRSPSVTRALSTCGCVRSSAASRAPASAETTRGSDTRASRTITGRSPCLERIRDLPDTRHEGRAAKGERLGLGERPDALERVAHEVVQTSAAFLPAPEEALDVLHPLEVGDGHASGVGED